MDKELHILQKCPFFRGRSLEDIEELLSKIQWLPRSFQKNEVIVSEGDPADHLGIVLSGQVEVQKIFPTGKVITMARFSGGETFGEAVLFSRSKQYPATVMAVEASRALFIHKQEMVKLFQLDAGIMTFFMESMSERVVLLSQKIEMLSLGTLRQKIAHILIKESKKQKSAVVNFPLSVRVWSEHLSVPRPSLSRELSNMKDKGWIEVDDNKYTIKDMEALENLLI